MQTGLHKGKTEALTNLLELKFGKLPDNVMEKFETASDEQLKKWSAHILTAKTLGCIRSNRSYWIALSENWEILTLAGEK